MPNPLKTFAISLEKDRKKKKLKQWSRGETREDRNDMREWRDVRRITGVPLNPVPRAKTEQSS